MRNLACVLMMLAGGLTACGGAAIPQEQLTTAQAAVRAAEVGGAPADPRASLHLKKAKDQIETAKALIADDDNERAAMILLRAEVDAELALALAQELGMQAQAAKARQEVEQLRTSIPQQGAPPQGGAQK
jgi:hypothetical protein